MSGIEQGLHSVQEMLIAAPLYVNLPKTVDSLKDNVASFGSQIKDLDVTVKGLKDSLGTLQQGQSVLQSNVTNLSVSFLFTKKL